MTGAVFVFASNLEDTPVESLSNMAINQLFRDEWGNAANRSFEKALKMSPNDYEVYQHTGSISLPPSVLCAGKPGLIFESFTWIQSHIRERSR